MRILHYDCQAGISGDMNLAALIDLGVDESILREELDKLGLPHWSWEVQKTMKTGLTGTLLKVHEEHEHEHEHSHAEHHHEHRHYADIVQLIQKSSLTESVQERAIAIFQVLAEAEAEVHGKTVDEVHFHEVGALDSIVDIVGAAIAIDLLKPDIITASRLELGGGSIHCAHGILPVPAPATALLVKNMPVCLGGTNHEATTPTGAAILATLVDQFEPAMSATLKSVGIGLGHRESAAMPNILRVMLLESSEELLAPTMLELSCNIDDMTAEQLSYFTEQLFLAGACDVWQTPIVMKKGRLATMVSALCIPQSLEALKKCFFTQSSTLGLRESSVKRSQLERQSYERATPRGKVQVKTAFLEGNVLKEKVEFEDRARIAREHGESICEQ